MKLEVEFHKRPSVLAYMARAFLPSPGLKKTGGFPPIRAALRSHQFDPAQMAEFSALSGLATGKAMHMLVPHVLTFPLQMAILTHPAHPLAIWGALQIRNTLVQHHPIAASQEVDIVTRVGNHRILEKGVEVDLLTEIRAGNTLVWESLNTYYYRGKFGPPGEPSPLAAAPPVGSRLQNTWTTVSGVGKRMAALTGDYNGIHYWKGYARRLGFPEPFHHPQLVLGQALARLPGGDPAKAQRLDTWLKGPVYYGRKVELKTSDEPNGLSFSVFTEGDDRPAMQGRWTTPH